ncbi:hypothetical protein DsansV1_C17g0146401 [Dioscorea sansibarensis]
MNYECSTRLSIDINACPGPPTAAGGGDDKSSCSCMASSTSGMKDSASDWSCCFTTRIVNLPPKSGEAKKSPTTPSSGQSLQSMRPPSVTTEFTLCLIPRITKSYSASAYSLSTPTISSMSCTSCSRNRVTSRLTPGFATIRPAIDRLSLSSSPPKKNNAMLYSNLPGVAHMVFTPVSTVTVSMMIPTEHGACSNTLWFAARSRLFTWIVPPSTRFL